MELDKALRIINNQYPQLPKVVIECIRDHKTEAIPALLQNIQRVLENNPNEDDSGYGFVKSLYILAELRAYEAFPYYLEFLRMSGDQADIALGDILHEDFPTILASVSTEDNISEIQPIALDESISIYHRAAAIRTLLILCNEGLYPREELVQFISGFFAAAKDDELLAMVISQCLKFNLFELHDQIQQLYEDGLVEESFISRDGFDRRRKESTLEIKKIDDSGFNFIADSVKELRWCYRFDNTQYFNNVGRNDPCPCGSGLKFKKCCGA